VDRGPSPGAEEAQATSAAAAAEEGGCESAPPESDGKKREDIVIALQGMASARLLPLRMVGPCPTAYCHSPSPNALWTLVIRV
jgi:hypothetical protein